MAQIASEEKAIIKLKMLDILKEDPRISINRLSKRCGISRATAKLYRSEIQTKIDSISQGVTQKIALIKSNQDGLWEKIKKTLQL